MYRNLFLWPWLRVRKVYNKNVYETVSVLNKCETNYEIQKLSEVHPWYS